MICQAHPNCKEPVVAKVGLPSKRAIWVCQRGFDEFEKAKGLRD
jgi:hypothetical protein